MPNSESLHPVSIVLFVILILSLIYHMYLHNDVQIPDEKNPPKEKTYSLLVNHMHSNMVKTFIFGVVTGGGLYTSIRNATIYGVLSPILLLIGF